VHKLLYYTNKMTEEFDKVNYTCAPFVPCARASECWDSSNPESKTANCWVLIYSLIFVGFFLIVLCELSDSISSVFWNVLYFLCIKKQIKKEQMNDNNEKTSTSAARSKENFLLNHDDPNLVLPSDYNSEYTHFSIKNKALPFRGFFAGSNSIMASSQFINVTAGSLGIAMICSAWSTFMWLSLDYDQQCSIQHPFGTWFEQSRAALANLVSEYAFYPIFLLILQVRFIVDRWREWMVNCHVIQGKMHDIGMLCGGSFASPPTRQQKELLYDIYRLLNAVHAVNYHSVSPYLSTLELKDFCDKLHLLTVDELNNLSKYKRKFRDGLLTLATNRIFILSRSENAGYQYNDMQRILTELRMALAIHHNMFIRESPNIYLSLMFAVVNTLLVFIILASPFTLLVFSRWNFILLPCAQPLVLVGSFLMIFSYRSAYSIIFKLRNPFSWMKDRINVDELLASTEMCLFTQLRVSFTDNNAYVYDSHPRKQTSISKTTNVSMSDKHTEIDKMTKDESRIDILDELSENKGKNLSLNHLFMFPQDQSSNKSSKMLALFKSRQIILSSDECREH